MGAGKAKEKVLIKKTKSQRQGRIWEKREREKESMSLRESVGNVGEKKND